MDTFHRVALACTFNPLADRCRRLTYNSMLCKARIPRRRHRRRHPRRHPREDRRENVGVSFSLPQE